MTPSPYPEPFNSAHNRAAIVKILLIVGAIAAGLSLFAEALSLAFPPITDDQELGDNPIGAAIVIGAFLVALFELLIYLTTVVFFSMWLYRAAANLRKFDPWTRLEHAPGWAVGSFFVPFANLIIPYRAVKEVWQKSRTPDDALLFEPETPASFPLWWLFWLASSFAGNISMRVSFNESVEENIATMISIAANALTIIAALFAYLVVDAIDKRQEEASQKLRLGKFSVPPPSPVYATE